MAVAPMTRQDRMNAFRHFWRIGDTWEIETAYGVTYIPPAIPAHLDLDDQLRLTIEHARVWIAAMFDREFGPVTA